ncbi:MAG: N-acetylmuramoyl-L-alanine amidase [Christensenellaceae bacterium]|nr:N-acetylmuramoyl-L-alanine amidase [Christensenellaceae bacterium]
MDERRQWRAVAALLTSIALFFALFEGAPARQAASPNLSSMPLFGRVIGIDPGHGGYDGGAVSATGRAEKEYNLEISMRLGAAVEALGGTVVYTREADIALIDPANTPGYKKRKELDNRISILQEANVDAVVSIHMNNFRPQRAIRGAQAFYRAGSAGGESLAQAVYGCLAQIEEARPRKPVIGDYYILNSADAAILMECGFLSNREEEKLLADGDYQTRLASAIARGLALYFETAP